MVFFYWKIRPTFLLSDAIKQYKYEHFYSLSVCFSTRAAMNIILHCTIALYFCHFLLLPSLVSAVLFFLFPKAATLHLNLTVAQIKICVRVCQTAWQRYVTFRERGEGRGDRRDGQLLKS